MKVLDKIYLLDCQALGMSHSWYDKPQVVEGIMVKPENVEYVRKDLLLEWAKKQYREYVNNPFYAGERDAYTQLIKKLNSL